MNMEATSINRLFRAGKLMRDMFGAEAFRPGKPLGVMRSLDADILEGRLDGHRRSGGGGAKASMARKLHNLIGSSRKLSQRTSSQGAAAFDKRQRAIVKIHYFNHGGGGGAALRAHARYVARDGASRAEPQPGDGSPDRESAEGQAKAHGRYLTRSGQGPSAFYDALAEQVDGARHAALWARKDRRHFRLILAPENGAALGELRNYTREVMRRAEAAMGTPLQWVAVDHWDTDNPHTHIILRGVRSDGRDLIIPREFVQHGFRSAARDVATERLGERSREDERLALHREVRAHRPTRLDQWIADQLDEKGSTGIADLRSPSGDPAATDALKGRARELKRLGLAKEIQRNVLQFEPGWRDGLKALELHLDIRKALMRSRALELAQSPRREARSISTMLQDGRGPDR